jgi:hypothetical protein
MPGSFAGFIESPQQFGCAGFIDANRAFAPMNNSPDQADRVGRVQTM